MTNLVVQALKKYSEHGIKKIELLQAKAAAGFRDVYNWLKAKIINEEPFKIGITIGNPALLTITSSTSSASLSAFTTCVFTG